MGSLPVDLANEEPFKQSPDHLWPRIMHAHEAKAVAGSRLGITSDQQANNKQGEWENYVSKRTFHFILFPVY
jgi:uncharacterized protein YfaA (DUF2138 family)